MTRVEGAYAQLPPGYAFMGGHGEFFGGTLGNRGDLKQLDDQSGCLLPFNPRFVKRQSV
jgi:hypothetical protein